MHHRELQGSLDSLHRYFDYAVRRGKQGIPRVQRGLCLGGAGLEAGLAGGLSVKIAPVIMYHVLCVGIRGELDVVSLNCLEAPHA